MQIKEIKTRPVFIFVNIHYHKASIKSIVFLSLQQYTPPL